MAVMEAITHGGVPVATSAGEMGNLVDRAGQLQYGQVLLGGGTAAGWRELVGWRELPGAQVSDSLRPQAHGAYPGDVWGDSLTVTFTFLLRGLPEDKLAALDALEQYLPMDSVERGLVVNDGAGPWYRMARVIARSVPMDKAFEYGPLECSVQFLCADPRRYALAKHQSTVVLPASSGGLQYPLDYATAGGLEYGTSSTGSFAAVNAGSIGTPLVADFHGPLTDPVLTTPDWSLGFNITLVDGETLTVDTSAGTVLLNGTADRLYTIRNDSDPIERCLLKPGSTSLALSAPAGTGRLVVTYHDARM